MTGLAGILAILLIIALSVLVVLTVVLIVMIFTTTKQIKATTRTIERSTLRFGASIAGGLLLSLTKLKSVKGMMPRLINQIKFAYTKIKGGRNGKE